MSDYDILIIGSGPGGLIDRQILLKALSGG